MLRKPRGFLAIAGLSTIECTDLQVTLSKDSRSDTASATFPVGAGGRASVAYLAGAAANIAMQATISSGDDGGSVLFDGIVDHVEVDWTDMQVRISGRDKTAKMLDKKSSAKHLNKKPHEIVQFYGSQSGVTVDADEVGEKAGKIYQIDYAALVHRMSDWAASQRIADLHNMIFYGTGGKLYFKTIDEELPEYAATFVPPSAGSPGTGNVLKLRTARNVHLGRPIKSSVHSWNHKKGELIKASLDASGDGDPLEFFNHHSGLLQDQAEARCKAHLDKITRHEFGADATMVGDPALTPRFMLALTGTGTPFDQSYEITTVDHHLSFSEGYTMNVSTKTKRKGR